MLILLCPVYNIKKFENEGLRVSDVDEKIIAFLQIKIEEAERAGCINWEKFREYCIEYGKHDPTILCVPIPVLDRCIAEARRRANYIDKINSPNG